MATESDAETGCAILAGDYVNAAHRLTNCDNYVI